MNDRLEAYASAWQTAHRRLYEHLCATTKDKPHATLEDLQPLYQAIAHGCHAGLQQEARHEVYAARILRGKEYYSAKKLGAFGSELGAVACFFETPWSRVSPALTKGDQAWLLNEAATRLRALGRLTEALEPMRAGLEMYLKQEHWEFGSRLAGNLSELELTLGDVAGAVRDAELSMTYADRSGDAFLRMAFRTTLADVLHQAGSGLGFPSGSAFGSRSLELFREAEQMQAESQPEHPLLYSLWGFRYCDLLMVETERTAWQATLDCSRLLPLWASQPAANAVGAMTKLRLAAEPTGDEALSQSDASGLATESGSGLQQSKTLHAVIQRATQALKISARNNWLLDIALDHLTLGRAAMHAAILNSADISILKLQLEAARSEIDQAVSGLRRSGQQHELPRGLLTRAWLLSLCGLHSGPDSAQSDLDEAWEIAERGPMPLFLADILLYRVRLFGRLLKEDGESRGHGDGQTQTAYPWGSVEADLAEARRLIVKHGYGRRLPELQDAEAALSCSRPCLRLT